MERFVFEIPLKLNRLAASPEGRQWLKELPDRVKACADLWSLQLESPYPEPQVSIVFPCTLPDGSPAALKVQFPHPECEHEAEALKRWNGQGAVRLLGYEPSLDALLIEKCEPGDHLSGIGADKALEVLIELLPRLWIKADKPFRSLHQESLGLARELPVYWERAGRPFEVELLNAALEAFNSLVKTQGEQVLLHQDLHGDNVLRATREPWLVIDPKPLIGEREFGLAPMIRSYEFGDSRKDVLHRLDTLSGALRLDRERVRLWSLAQTLAWSFEGNRAMERHVNTARWLWQA